MKKRKINKSNTITIAEFDAARKLLRKYKELSFCITLRTIYPFIIITRVIVFGDDAYGKTIDEMIKTSEKKYKDLGRKYDSTKK